MANQFASTTRAVAAGATGAVAITQTILDVYSKDILFNAQPVLRFEQFAVKKTDLQAQPGLTIKMTVYNNLALGRKLQEAVPIETQALSASQREITVYEYGNAVSVTELLLQASFDDTMANAAKLLGMDYAKTLDNELKTTVLSGTQVVYPNAKTSRGTLVATDLFNSNVIKDVIEVLATNNVGKYANDHYVMFVHPHHARGIRNDVEFQNVTTYGKQYAGEIGRIHDIVFIETTQMPKIAKGTNGAPATVDVFQAVAFGENAYGLATALPVEMRDGGIEDFGRLHKLAWYSIFGCAILEDVNIVRIETA
jgi:N4-gp56 family major capsid protein